jgi:hypothetical protein
MKRRGMIVLQLLKYRGLEKTGNHAAEIDHLRCRDPRLADVRRSCMMEAAFSVDVSILPAA